MDMASEGELISALAQIFAKPNPQLIVTIGDDAAVFQSSSPNTVAAADMAVEGVHFDRRWSSLHEIGAKIAAANLADIYAMGAQAKYLLVSVGLTKDFSIPQIKELAQGIKSEADLVGAQVIGGDISKADQLVISISAIGEVTKPITRSGAKVGDLVILSNLTGNSAAGLFELKAGFTDSPFIKAHKKPNLNYAMSKDFAQPEYLVNSMSDVSDGLLSELDHIATASGVGIEIDPELFAALPGFGTLSFLAEQSGNDVWEWILNGGEDHAFVATTSNKVPSGAIVIGKVVSGTGVEILNLSNIKAAGYRHF